MAPAHVSGQQPAATRHGKPTLVKKTAVDRFNDSRQDETRRLDLKRKMEHEEKMASIHLKKHKYDLRYGSPQIPGSPVVAAQSKEDKQIEILRLQIRLAELNRDNSIRASSSQLPCNPFDEVSTPSSAMSGPSYLSGYSHNGIIDNQTASEGPYSAPDNKAPDGVASWPEFSFAA